MDQLIKTLLDGTQILTAVDIGVGEIHGQPGAEHLGFGMFIAKSGDKSINFDAGGAMRNVRDEQDKHVLSWTPVTGDTDAFDIMSASDQLVIIRAWASDQGLVFQVCP